MQNVTPKYIQSDDREDRIIDSVKTAVSIEDEQHFIKQRDPLTFLNPHEYGVNNYPPVDEIFTDSCSDGFATSLSSHQLPLTISDKALSGVVPAENVIRSFSRDGWTITHTAAALTKTDKEPPIFYFATKAALSILDALWDMVGLKQCRLEQIGSTFTVTFRKQDLRKYLAENGKQQNGTQLNLQFRILQGSVMTVSYDGKNGRKVHLTGAYLQNAHLIESDDPREDGLFKATLHPVIADDLMQGRFRDVEKMYLTGNTEANEIYKACIHRMRHQFTNADAYNESRTFQIWFADILFSAGKLQTMTTGAMRRAINSLRQSLLSSGVISDAENLVSELKYDAIHDVKDYFLQITPSIAWGKSQKISNAKYREHNEKIRLLALASTTSSR